MEIGRLGGGGEPDRAVQAVVVGDGQPAQTELDGTLDEVVRRRGAIEEREVRMALQFGVTDHGKRLPRVLPGGAVHGRTCVLMMLAVLLRTLRKFSRNSMKQDGPIRRLNGMITTIRPIATVAARSMLMVVIAMLLVLVLLPAVLGAQAASS